MYEVIAEMLLIFKNYLRDVLKMLLHEMYCFISVEIIKTLAAYCSNSLQTFIIFAESKRTCASPPLIKNGVIKSSTVRTYENGSSVEYRCFEHHFLQGSQESYCLEGVWTIPPLCLGKYCHICLYLLK